jgi:hypothetical protein
LRRSTGRDYGTRLNPSGVERHCPTADSFVHVAFACAPADDVAVRDSVFATDPSKVRRERAPSFSA